ncbi:unnamed protein product [Caenorhabditis bovis]|uniref:SH2 domain-containing protein n=1 Tax=Caenorhabditis bovis TaxID=2654633 RepID=A0A8S1F3U5_9PELO|nr:unnamed protein product [Caenorhabditis bovis]
MASQGLLEQVWYWGDVDKSVVSRALADQPEGAFIVRNASTIGDYTLSVKYQGQVKLVKIVVRGNRCGFSIDSLVHETVVQLIEFHRNVSLLVYNDQLDVKLTYPVPTRRNSQNGRLAAKKTQMSTKSILDAKDSEDWDERLGLESLRIAQMSVERAARLFDLAHQEVERAENLFHERVKQCRDYEMKLEKLGDLHDVEENINKTIPRLEGNYSFRQAMKGNQKVLEDGMQKIRLDLAACQEQRKRISDLVDELKVDSVHAKNRVIASHETRNKVYGNLASKGIPQEKLQTTMNATGELILNEPLRVSQLLCDLPLRWVPGQYLVYSTSKEDAATALLAARERMYEIDKKMGIIRPPIDGVFLIRPSSSQPDKLVLSVLYGERISHCLIEQSEQGWGFEHSNIYLTTIGDFVRYYAHTTLETHNDQIKTTLAMPAFPPPPDAVLENLPKPPAGTTNANTSTTTSCTTTTANTPLTTSTTSTACSSTTASIATIASISTTPNSTAPASPTPEEEDDDEDEEDEEEDESALASASSTTSLSELASPSEEFIPPS